MKHKDLVAGELYAYSTVTQTVSYYSPERVRLVGTDKYAPAPVFSRQRVTVIDGAQTVELSGREYRTGDGVPLIAVCRDKPDTWNNHSLVSVSQLRSTWAEWEVAKVVRDAARESAQAKTERRLAERAQTIGRVTARLTELGVPVPVMAEYRDEVTVSLAWLERLAGYAVAPGWDSSDAPS